MCCSDGGRTNAARRRPVQPEAYHRLAARQATYWWYRARRVLARSLLQRFGVRAGARAIDIGCGCGGNLALFDAVRPSLVVGLDLSPIALAHARQAAPGATLVQADLSRDLPLADGGFDVATLFNVLYHDWVHDDGAVLRRIARLLRPGGLLLVTEPAFAVLRRGLDRAVMGQRRYNAAGFRALAEGAGFDVVLCSYFTCLAFPFALVGALLNRMRTCGTPRPQGDFSSIDFTPLPGGINELLFRLASWEARVIGAGWRVPFGVGIVAVLRRREGAA